MGVSGKSTNIIKNNHNVTIRIFSLIKREFLRIFYSRIEHFLTYFQLAIVPMFKIGLHHEPMASSAAQRMAVAEHGKAITNKQVDIISACANVCTLFIIVHGMTDVTFFEALCRLCNRCLLIYSAGFFF